MEPTEEQVEIMKQVKTSSSNLQVNALAGTGKSTTLKMIDATFTEPCLYLAFNRAIVTEAEKEREEANGGTCFRDITTIKTFNGLGHGVWAKTVSGKVILDKDKTKNLLNTRIEKLSFAEGKHVKENYIEIIQAVGLAKSLGYIPESIGFNARRLVSREDFHEGLEEKPSPIISELIDSILTESITTAYKGFIDFNDQIYMPALFGGSFPRFERVLIDETQDLNPVQHVMCEKLSRGSWVGICGDRWQSIYAFRGADTSSMEKFHQKFNTVEMDLSVTFRCPEAIVNAVKWRVPNYKWRKSGGIYKVLSELQITCIPEGAAIICRNNAPLYRLAFQLLREKRGVSVAGSEIGPRVIRLLRKVGVEGDSRAALITKINGWRDEKLQRANNVDSIHDMAECMLVFASQGENFQQAVAYAELLFRQQGTIYLTTGHKAKGREWETVFHLDPWLINDTEQDKNLKYVIMTRAKEELYEIDSERIT